MMIEYIYRLYKKKINNNEILYGNWIISMWFIIIS